MKYVRDGVCTCDELRRCFVAHQLTGKAKGINPERKRLALEDYADGSFNSRWPQWVKLWFTSWCCGTFRTNSSILIAGLPLHFQPSLSTVSTQFCR